MALKARATQEFIPIEEIRDGIVSMKDGGMRAVILVSSVNFSLKGEDEKTAIILQFQDFLNSLDFSIQIFIESRRLDIRPYLALLEGQKKNQVNDLMKIQIDEYIQFIRSFTESTNIMKKDFFIVVPYTPASLQASGGVSGMFSSKTKSETTAAKTENFDDNRTQLEQRIAVVEQGLVRCGIRVARLGTEEVVELVYKMFNPGDSEKPMMQEQQ